MTNRLNCRSQNSEDAKRWIEWMRRNRLRRFRSLTQLTIGQNPLISDKADPGRDALRMRSRRAAAKCIGWGDSRTRQCSILRPCVYGGDSFCLMLQQKLGFDLCSPADDLLLRVPSPLLKRQLAQRTLADALSSPR
jgi:hypothetical protein